MGTIKYSDDVELLFIELPKFRKELGQLRDIQDRWIYFVKNAGSLEYIPDSLGSDPFLSFPRSAWECRPRRSASRFGTQSVPPCIPTPERGNDKFRHLLSLRPPGTVP
ncbi:MAG: Rpn family recombination-promoting nuclease/putative transposase [Gammaproteobacteria bacterium]|nr:Rpn family recombination-promoting nuclease/putative transposase [Gammaproteobacteria bacterium]MBU1655034.1 Rpn family recombination-promoting nuclease/putative transposase [Gammaproteobacteria bacterium]MBU1961531.1 Rpn family recombination-promoting nuclease/putative transposase [Gammaproteobacteria bacterium]